jgi:hypothetical protein
MATRECFNKLDRASTFGQALVTRNVAASRSALFAGENLVATPVTAGAPLTSKKSALLRHCKLKQRGYMTTAVVSILALLSLLATQVTIGVTVDAFRVAATNQGLAAIVYAGEVALKDSVARISNNLSELTVNLSCFSYDFGDVTIADSGLSQVYQMKYYAEFIETRSSRDLYRVYATAEASIFKTTVSQIASIDSSAGTVYLLPGTWSNTLPKCE